MVLWLEISENSTSVTTWNKSVRLHNPWGKNKMENQVLTFCSFSGLGCRLLNRLLGSSTSRAPPEWRYEDQTALPRPVIAEHALYSTFLPDSKCGTGERTPLPQSKVLSLLNYRQILGLVSWSISGNESQFGFDIVSVLEIRSLELNNFQYTQSHSSHILAHFLHCPMRSAAASSQHAEEREEWNPGKRSSFRVHGNWNVISCFNRN